MIAGGRKNIVQRYAIYPSVTTLLPRATYIILIHFTAHCTKLDRHGTKIPHPTLRAIPCWNPSFRNLVTRIIILTSSQPCSPLLPSLLVLLPSPSAATLLFYSQKIFSFMAPADICVGAARVNRKWHTIAYDNMLWRNICSQKGIELPAVVDYKMDARNNYMDGYRRVQNWTRGKYKSHTLSGHKEIVWSVLSDGDKIISGSEDMTIKIWEADSGMCLNTLKGHKNGTVSYQLLYKHLYMYCKDVI